MVLGVIGERGHLGAGRSDGVAGIAELRDEVDLVPAFRSFRGFRQEVGLAAAQHHLRPGGVELLHDPIVFGAPARMRHHRGGRGIFDLGVGHDADRHPGLALHQTGDGLDLGIVERIGGAVGIDPHGIHRRLVAGRIRAGRIRGVGDDRIAARGGDQRHVRHVVDRELAARLALGNALGQHPRRHPVRERHAVADEQDHVLGLARPGIVDVPAEFARARTVAHLQSVSAGLRERDVAQQQGRLVLAVLALDERGGLAQNLGMVRSVQRHGHLCRIGQAGKLDFEVEARAGEDVRPVDRVDGLRDGGRSDHRHGDTCGCGQESAHVMTSTNPARQT